MEAARRDLVDSIAPPPPRERWRWIIYGGLLAAIVGLLANHQSSGSNAAPSAQAFDIETSNDLTVLTYRWPNHGSAKTLSSIRSMHDAVSIVGVEGLPQRVGAGESAAITVRLRIDCTRLLASSQPILRLDADERFGRSSRDEINIGAVTSPGGPVCDQRRALSVPPYPSRPS